MFKEWGIKMIKCRIFSSILSVIALLGMISVFSISSKADLIDFSTVSDTTSLTEQMMPSKLETNSIDGFVYEIIDGEVCITDYTGSASDITIPSFIEGYPVTSIGSAAFYQCIKLKSITIPFGVISIGTEAFYECINLRSVDIPNSVTSIGSSAFSGCDNLTSITIPEGLTSISSGLFCGCARLAKVVIPNSVTSIGSYAFQFCTKLTEVTIPHGVTTIEDDAFYGCSSLVNITIPDSVTNIGAFAFYRCSSLLCNTYDNALYLGNELNPYYALVGTVSTSITDCIIHPDTVLIGGSAFQYCALTDIVIPESVINICAQAFYDCTSLKNVTIPSSVTSIGDSAFGYCTSLVNIVIPEGVTSIGSWVFSDCKYLTSITIPDSVTSIGSYAFFNCNSLKKVFINDLSAWCGISFTYHGYANPLFYDGALYLNNELVTELIIPEGVTEIKDRAFFGYSSLTYVSIPNSVTNIGSSAFEDCNNLRKIRFWGSAPLIETDSFGDVIAAAYYPYGNGTWVDDVMQDYRGYITWVPVGRPVPGDVDGDRVINNEDVAYLLWFTLFPEDYPVSNDVDFNCDGIVNNQDVQYLLWHTLFPEDYPLTSEPDSSDNVVNAGALSKHENGWVSDRGILGLYFNMRSNDLPYNSDWSVVYEPCDSSVVKLGRWGNIFDIGSLGTTQLVKLSNNAYCLLFDDGFVEEYGSFRSGDVLIIEGNFSNYDNGYTIHFDKVYVRFNSSSQMQFITINPNEIPM